MGAEHSVREVRPHAQVAPVELRALERLHGGGGGLVSARGISALAKALKSGIWLVSRTGAKNSSEDDWWLRLAVD